MKEFIPVRSNMLSKQLTMGLFIISVAAMFFSGLPNLPFRSVMQLLSLTLLAVAMGLLGRYEMRRYSYAIVERDGGGHDLTVTEIKRRSRITVCRVSLEGVSEALDITKENKKQLKQMREGRKYFNYCVDLSPAHTCTIVANEGGEEYLISLSYIPELFEILSAAKDS